MVKIFNHDTEEQLLGAFRQMEGLVDEGVSPTQAAIKTAMDMQLPPHMIRRMCQGYNIATQNSRRDGNDASAVKYASFDLADGEEAIAAVYSAVNPSQKKTAADYSSYDSSPTWLQSPVPPSRLMIKAASDVVVAAEALTGEAPAPLRNYHDRFATILENNRQMAHGVKIACAETELYRTQMGMERALSEIDSYFHKVADIRRPMAEVEYDASLLFGRKVSDAIFSKLASLHPRESRADFTKHPPISNPKVSEEPYSFIDRFLKLANDFETTLEDLNKLRSDKPETPAHDKIAADAETKRKAEIPKLSQWCKEANLLTGAAGGLGSGLARSLTEAKDNAKQRTLDELEFSDLDDQVRQLEAKSVLSDILANDEVLSEADPNTVLKHFNEVTQLSPALARQSAALRPILRQQVAGNPGVFDVMEAARLGNILNTQAKPQPVPGEMSNV